MKQRFTKFDLTLLFGNALEHFDSALYGFLVPLLAPLFFPNHDAFVQLIFGYSILGTSLITRPLGAYIFGTLVRKRGVLSSLTLSFWGISFSTLALGLLPTYDAWGAAAPIGLVLLRMVRGVFGAGEIAIAKLYIMEGKDAAGSFRASYAYPASSMAGTLMASCGATASAFMASDGWSWRLWFIVGGVTGLVGNMMRRHARKSVPTTKFSDYQRGFLQLLWIFKKAALRVALTTGLSHLTAVLPFLIFNSLIPLVTNIPFEKMMAFNTALLVFDLIFIPMAGRFLAAYDPRKVLIFSGVVLALSFPLLLMPMDHHTSLTYVTFVRFWIVFWGVVFLCPQHVYYKGLFDDTSNAKYLVVGLGNALGAATIGKLSPGLMTWFFQQTGSFLVLGIYASVIAGITLFFLCKR